MKYSAIVILEKDQANEDSINFIKGIHTCLEGRFEPFEVLIIANGLGGFLRSDIIQLLECYDRMRAFEFPTRTSQTICLKSGIRESSGEIIVLCGSYQQIPLSSLGALLDGLDVSTDFVAPSRQNRVDTYLNQIQSKAFNGLVGFLTGSKCHDLSCTIKVFRREVFNVINIYGNLYRFLPILADQNGFKIKELKCDHIEQRGKSTYYGLGYYLDLLIDILTLYFNTRFTRKPLRFFSSIGLAFSLVGTVLVFHTSAQKLFLGQPIGGRSELLLGIFLIVLGVQAASAGLLGEIIAFVHGRHKGECGIEKTI